MKIIYINEIKFEVNKATIMNMMECITMHTEQEILIRNKQDAGKLSKKTHEMLDESRKMRLKQAIKDNDILYLNSIYENFSILDLLKLLCKKTINHLNL